MIEDDVHDMLIKAYLDYFKANEKFEKMNSVSTHRAVRKCLRDIRALAKERADEIHELHNTTRVTRKDK